MINVTLSKIQRGKKAPLFSRKCKFITLKYRKVMLIKGGLKRYYACNSTKSVRLLQHLQHLQHFKAVVAAAQDEHHHRGETCLAQNPSRWA